MLGIALCIGISLWLLLCDATLVLSVVRSPRSWYVLPFFLRLVLHCLVFRCYAPLHFQRESFVATSCTPWHWPSSLYMLHMSLVHVVVLHGGLHVHKEKLTTSIVCVSTESAGFKLFKQLVHVTFVLVASFLIAQLRSAWGPFFDLFCQHGFWKA